MLIIFQIFEAGFRATQDLISKKFIASGHDVSDGGVITTLLEMAFSGNCGLSVDIPCRADSTPSVNKAIDTLFSEELGLVLEVKQEHTEKVVNVYRQKSVPCYLIGQTTGSAGDAVVSVKVDGSLVLKEKMVQLRDVWEATSFQLERLQTNPRCVEEEEAGLRHRHAPKYSLSFTPSLAAPINPSTSRPKIAVIREEGSNGDREMVSSFHMAGFETWDVTMNDLCRGSITLAHFRGVVFVGGFSYADVLGSAKGWAAVCDINATARAQFDAFLARDDTFSLGVCNGCQLMGLLGWVGATSYSGKLENQSAATRQEVCFTHNTSERFESRFVTVAIQSSPAVMLRGMEGSSLGIWVAHGEGRVQFRKEDTLQAVTENNLVPIRYVDDQGKSTTRYPLNPNGSPKGIAALCSPNGRHLAVMPHPERCTLLWQWPWMPQEWKESLEVSPWLRMFQNAYHWCMGEEAS